MIDNCFPPPYSLGYDNFAIESTITVLRNLPRPALFGIVKRQATITLPEFPADAIASEFTIGDSNNTIAGMNIRSGYLDERAGEAQFAAYLHALDEAFTKYALRCTTDIETPCLWPTFDVIVKDTTSAHGCRSFALNHGLDPTFAHASIETLDLLRRPAGDNAVLWYADHDDLLAPFGEKVTLTQQQVIVNYYDFDDDSDDADERLRTVALSRSAFIDAFDTVARRTREQVAQVERVLARHRG